MDWHTFHGQTFADYLDDLDFVPQPAKSFRIQPESATASSTTTGVRCDSQDLPDEAAMDGFIQQYRAEMQKQRKWSNWTLTILMLQRGPPNQLEKEGQASADQLWTLGCTRKHFEALASDCGVNKSFPDCLMADRSHYSRHHIHGPETEYTHTSFNIRSSPYTLRDRALSSTSSVDKLSTFVLITGCTPKDFTLVEDWLDTMKEYGGHPLLMVALFLELYHQYLKLWYRELSQRCATRLHSAFRRDESADILRQTENYRDEINKAVLLQGDLDRLDAEFTAFKLCIPDITASLDFISEKAPRDQADYLRAYGARLKDYIAHLSRETEYFQTKNSKAVSNTASLISSLWGILASNDNQISHQISIASKKDSSIMMGITVGTLTFLPGTAMATIFAMPLFDWTTSSGTPSVHGAGLRVYLAVTLPLTAATIILLLIWVMRIDPKTGERKSTLQSTRSLLSSVLPKLKPTPMAGSTGTTMTTTTTMTGAFNTISVTPAKITSNTSPPGP